MIIYRARLDRSRDRASLRRRAPRPLGGGPTAVRTDRPRATTRSPRAPAVVGEHTDTVAAVSRPTAGPVERTTLHRPTEPNCRARKTEKILIFFTHPTPNGGSLGSWIDEDRSYLRVVV